MILAAGLARRRAANRSSAPGMRGKIRMLPLAERTLIGPRRLGSSQMQRIDLSSPGLTPRRGLRIHCAPGQRRLGMSRRLQPSRKIGHRDTSLCRAVEGLGPALLTALDDERRPIGLQQSYGHEPGPPTRQHQKGTHIRRGFGFGRRPDGTATD